MILDENATYFCGIAVVVVAAVILAVVSWVSSRRASVAIGEETALWSRARTANNLSV